jgi:hypothetical protein
MSYLFLYALIALLSLNSLNFGIQFNCRQATLEDIPALMQLLDNEAAQERDKIVILPKRFRESAFEQAIRKGRFFVAVALENECDTSRIVAFKKLYYVTEPDELREILHDELRCLGYMPVDQVTLDAATLQPVARSAPTGSAADTLYIYTGSDFTLVDYRGYGINARLTEYALDSVRAAVITAIERNNYSHMSLVYGLTKANAGDTPAHGRTVSIAKLFAAFAHEIAALLDRILASELGVQRYAAYMPTFASDAEQCIPLPEKDSVPGFGCLLTYPLQARLHQQRSLLTFNPVKATTLLVAVLLFITGDSLFSDYLGKGL